MIQRVLSIILTGAFVAGSFHCVAAQEPEATLDVGEIRALGGYSSVPSIEFPKGSGLIYGGGLVFFGCVRGIDTIFASHTTFEPVRVSSTRKSSSYYDPGAHAEQQLYGVWSDTAVDPVDSRPRFRIGVECHTASYAWSDGFSKRFILTDSWFKNISGVTIEKAVIGVSYWPLIAYWQCWPPFRLCDTARYLNGDDVCGVLQTVPGIIPGTLDTMNLVWSGDNDGDPDADAGLFTTMSQTAVMGIRILRSPSGGRLSYNWWSEDPPWPGELIRKWGPRLTENRYLDGRFVGAPDGSQRGTYRIATNGEIDYDQVYSAMDHRSEGWAAPPSDARWALDIADGTDVHYILSYGPLPDIAPGDSMPLTVAYIMGANFHRSPVNFAKNFDPADPTRYLAGLDFSDLIRNARWADWVFDNPGVDTDHDGNRGRAYLVNCDAVDTGRMDTVTTGTNPPETTLVPVTMASGCDSVFYRGDGVPDFRGPQSPSPPGFQLTSKPGQVILRWNGAFTELERDPMTRKRDFEGYKVYAGRLDKDDQYSLIASWDKDDYKRFAYRADSSIWSQISDPLSPEQWRQVLNNPQFDPRAYATASLASAYRDSTLDTTRDARGDITWIGYRERYSYWIQEDFNRANRYWETDHWEDNLIQQVEVRDTLIDNKALTYGVYEITIGNLQYSSPLYFAITAFDFGDYEKALDPLESSPTNNSQYGHPIYSANVVIDSGLKVGVYPNPYKISYEDAFGNPTSYYAEGYEAVGHDQFTEHDRRIHFINLPDTATIRIYSLDGDLIRTIHHPDKFLTTYSSSVGWDLVSRNAQAVISGIYIYRVDSRLGTQIGKIAIIK